MDVEQPTTVAGVVDALAARPDALLLAGGTDLMVAVNAGWVSPTSVVSLRRVAELEGWQRDGGALVVGAGLTYTGMLGGPFAAMAPALASAARTVGSPQIRNAGTLGGNLGTGSPAGDTLPVLVALDATVELAGPDGPRSLPMHEFVLGPKRTALRPAEVIAGVRFPAATGPQQYRKVGVRNAMVIAVASVAVVLDLPGRRVGVGLGSVGPVPLPAPDAAGFAAAAIDWSSGSLLEPDAARRFGELVADAASPIDDHRGSAAYRRHAVRVLAERCLRTACAADQSEDAA